MPHRFPSVLLVNFLLLGLAPVKPVFLVRTLALESERVRSAQRALLVLLMASSLAVCLVLTPSSVMANALTAQKVNIPSVTEPRVKFVLLATAAHKSMVVFLFVLAAPTLRCIMAPVILAG